MVVAGMVDVLTGTLHASSMNLWTRYHLLKRQCS